MKFSLPQLTAPLRRSGLLLLLAAYAIGSQACGTTRIPDDHTATLRLERPWKTLPAGTSTLQLRVHPLASSGDTEGGSFFHPVESIPVELSLGSGGSSLASFSSTEIRHTRQTQQIPGMGRDCTRDVETFEGQNAEGVRIHGTVTSQYAVHWVDGSGRNAWQLDASFDLSDASGALGHVTGSEYVDW